MSVPVTETPAERIEEARETIELLRRIDRAEAPTPETVAEFHELHAAHERKRGHFERARQAEQRAARLRERA